MNAPTSPEPHELLQRSERQTQVVRGLEAVLPSHALLWQREDTTPYECDGLTAYRQHPLVVALPETLDQHAGLENLPREETITFDPVRTKMTARPIQKPFSAAVVMARVGHRPSTSRNVGFSRTNPLLRALPKLFMPVLLGPSSGGHGRVESGGHIDRGDRAVT